MKHIVKESMTKDLVTIGWKEGLDSAYRLMRKENIRHLPVLDSEGGIVGILSDRDLNRAMQSKFEDKGFRSEIVNFDARAEVRDYMTWPVKTFNKDVELRVVAKQMIKDKISSFMVNDGDQIVGIITTEDLLKVLVELLGEPQPNFNWNLESLIRSPMRNAFA